MVWFQAIFGTASIWRSDISSGVVVDVDVEVNVIVYETGSQLFSYRTGIGILIQTCVLPLSFFLRRYSSILDREKNGVKRERKEGNWFVKGETILLYRSPLQWTWHVSGKNELFLIWNLFISSS